jgi:hypothetical protein
MRSLGLIRAVVLALLATGAVAAQTIPFNLLVTLPSGDAVTVPNDQTIPFNTTVGTQTQATVTATYIGNSQATITTAPQDGLLGSNQFKVTSTVVAPLVLNRGDSFKFTITYAPTNTSLASGQLTVPFTEPDPMTGMPAPNAIVLALQGTTPAFTLSYVLDGDNNVIQIPDGGTIPFKPTLINATSSANLNITDTGSGGGVITAITPPPSGSAFKVQGIPLLPSTLASGTTLTLLVTYTPTAVQADTGQIQITFQGGATETVNLTGSGITSTFTYSYLVNGSSQTVAPGDTIMLQGANVGSTSSVIVQVKNSGNASGTINSVSTSGPFTLTNPLALPVTVTNGNSFSVPITFTPTEVGTQTGQLVIGNDFFNLSAQGLGPKLTFSYTSNAGSTDVDPTKGGAVVFSPVEVGKSEQVTFTVKNSGLLAATISNIGIQSGPYTTSGITLPLVLQPGGSTQFTITFKPTDVGFQDGTLNLDTTMISLIGSGTTPEALPAYTFSGPSGTVAPQTQSSVSLSLTQSYPLDLNGTLTMTTDGSFGTDPAVQFSTGGRTVDFTIASGSTDADFAGQGSQVLVQTGTVAEAVTLSPTFTTSGGVNVTPSSPTKLQFTVPSVAPVLLTAQVTGETSNSFNLVLVGYSTTRSLSSLNVTFNPAPGFNIGTGQLSIDLSGVSTAWFQSTASQTFGGQFLVTMPFTLQGTPKTGQTLLQSIASVSATVSNSVGTSNSLQTNIP